MEAKMKIVYALMALMLVVASVAGIAAYKNAKNNQALEAEKEVLNNDIKALEADKDVLAEEIVSLNEGNKELENTVTDLELKQDELEAEIEDLKAVPEVETIEGYIIDEILLGDDVAGVYDDGEVEYLFDGDIEFNDNDYEVYEELILSSGAELLASGLGDDEEMCAMPYLGFTGYGALSYMINFEAIDMSEIGLGDDQDTLVIPFLGKEVEIVSLDNDDMVIRNTQKITMKQGDILELEGGDLVFIDVSANEDKALFSFNGENVFAEENHAEDLPNGMEIIVDSVIASYSVDKADDWVTFYLGDSVEEEYENGQEMVEDPDWLINWDALGDLTFIEVVYDEKSLELDDDYTPLALGEEILYPYGIYGLKFYELNELDYLTIESKFDEEEISGSDKMGMWLEASENVFVIDRNEVDKVFTDGTYFYYLDDDNDLVKVPSSLGEEVAVKYEDTDLLFKYNSGNLRLKTLDGSEKLTFDINVNSEKLGLVEEEAEAAEVDYNGFDIGSKECDVLTKYGIVVKTPEDNGDDDKFELSIPSEQIEASFILG